MVGRRIAAGLATMLAVLGGAVAVRLTDGNPVLATIAVGSTPVGMALAAQTGRAFVVNNGDDSISVINTRSGTLARTVGVGSGPVGLVVDERDRRVFVTNAAWRALEQAGQIVAYEWLSRATPSMSVLDAESGRLLTTVAADVSVEGVVVDAPSWRMFVSENDFHNEGLGIFAAGTRRAMSRTSVFGSPIAVAQDRRARRTVIVSGTLNRGAIVTMIDTATARPVQRSVIDVVFGRHPLAVDQMTGRTFVAAATVTANNIVRGSISVFDTRTGTLLSTIALPSAPTAVAVDERTGHVFVSMLGPATLAVPMSTSSGTVMMLDARSGTLLRSTGVGIGPGPLVVDERHRRVLVVNVGGVDRAGNPFGPGSLSVLDARSGEVLRTIPVGVAPGDIAVDQRAGRALVLNYGGTVSDTWGWLPAWLQQRIPFLSQRASGHAVAGSVTVLDIGRL